MTSTRPSSRNGRRRSSPRPRSRSIEARPKRRAAGSPGRRCRRSAVGGDHHRRLVLRDVHRCSMRSAASCCRRRTTVVRYGILDRATLREILDATWSTAKVAIVGPRDRVGARYRDRCRHVPGPMGRALAVPLGRRAPDRADPGDRAADRLLVGVRLPQPRARLRPDLALPDDHQHALRAAQRAGRPARPLLAAPRSRWTRLAKLEFPAALPAIFVGLRISCRALGDRRDRRRLLLPPGRPRASAG